MTIEFVLPELGENITSGEVVNVLVAINDVIEVNQPVLEIETDKAVVEVPSSIGGVVKEILIKAGDVAKPGQVILTVEADGEQGTHSKPSPKTTAPQAPAAEEKPPAQPEPSKTTSTSSRSFEVGPTDIEARLPELGENVQAGTVVSILVSIGDEVKVDQPLFEVETDKAVAEVPATIKGVIKEILIKEGDTVASGQTVMIITADGTQSARPEQKAPAPSHPETQSTAPSTEESASQKVKSAPAHKPASPAKIATLPSDKPARPHYLVPAAPSVRRFAREIGIDISHVTGTGPGGRLSFQDIKNYARQRNRAMHQVIAQGAPSHAQAPAQVVTGPTVKPLPDFSKWGDVERKSMGNVRRLTAENLSYAWNVVPHVTQFDKADITDLEKLRKRFARKVEAAGGKLTITAILLKVLVSALKVFPQFNASVDMANKEVVYKKYYHIGVAADTDRGLLVPVVKNVDQKNIIQLSVELNELAAKARDRKLKLDEMQGATFTISNLGGIGGTAFTPIVNTPEVAILGVSRGRMEPVYNKETGQFEPRFMVPLSLSYDHRLIDGADAARFTRWVAEALEQPFLLALEG